MVRLSVDPSVLTRRVWAGVPRVLDGFGPRQEEVPGTPRSPVRVGSDFWTSKEGTFTSPTQPTSVVLEGGP